MRCANHFGAELRRGDRPLSRETASIGKRTETVILSIGNTWFDFYFFRTERRIIFAKKCNTPRQFLAILTKNLLMPHRRHGPARDQRAQLAQDDLAGTTTLA